MDKKLQATLRKQRQRNRQKGAGLVRLEVCLTEGVVKHLDEITELTGGSRKDDAEVALRRALAAYHAELLKARDHGLILWKKLQGYLPYRAHLIKPGDYVRVHELVLRYEEMAHVDREMEGFLDLMKRRGWSEKRTFEMLRRSAGKYVDPLPSSQ